MPTQWTCPYCNRACTIGESDIRLMSGTAFISDEYGAYEGTITVIVCPSAARGRLGHPSSGSTSTRTI